MPIHVFNFSYFAVRNEFKIRNFSIFSILIGYGVGIVFSLVDPFENHIREPYLGN